jgi:hypothetical protein
MKTYAKLLATVVAALITAGCATTERLVYLQPDCAIPPLPVPPEVSATELDPLADDVYWRVLRREREITDSLLEHRAILKELCQ